MPCQPLESVKTHAAASPSAESNYKYWAFISYSHRDKEWAQWLHTALETYRIPARLAQRSAGSDAWPSRDRIYPVFLDREELSGGFDLGERIRTALEQSCFLIVICSPHAVASHHVQQEIDAFESLGREHRVLCLIIDGEPGASGMPASGLQECLPAPVRTRRTPEGELVPCEPIAADARKAKDGKTNAKLKILAEMLGVPFAELRQRDEHRRLRRRLQMAAAVAGVSVVVGTGYLLALDAGVNAPGGTITRQLADRFGLSILRRLPSEAVVHQQAAALRRRLSSRLRSARRGDWFVSRFKPEDWRYNGVWIHSQIAFALLNMPDGEAAGLQGIVSSLENPFVSELKIERTGTNYGWLARPGERSPLSIPAFWTAMSLAVALGKDGYLTAGPRARALEHLTYVQDGLAQYQPNDSAGWNLFPHQRVSAQHNVYAATVALMALLELRRSDLSWQGSVEQRDRLLRQTFDWLVDQFDHRGNPPGWKADDDANVTFEGLSLQIYGRLLDAQAEAGLTIPPAIVQEIPRHLAGIVDRTLDFPDRGAEFYSTVAFDAEEFVARESITFPWYSWALDCAARWLRSEYAHNAAAEDLVAVKRTLNHLIITLGDEAVTKALDDITTYQAAEMLYALSAVVPLNAAQSK